MLTGIYNTTELVMMQDSSPGFEDTWRFLQNRVADAMAMSNTASQVTLETGVHAANPISPRICRHTWLFHPADPTSAERPSCCCQFKIKK